MSERPVQPRSRRLSDWINPADERKEHSLIDKIYKQKNLQIAWERVKANQGAGGIDGVSVKAFDEEAERHLERLHQELRTGAFRPIPVKQVRIPKAGKPGEFRMLGIPSIFDRVCQQAVLNRLGPIFEPDLDDANFGYRTGRSTKDALRKVWKEIQEGRTWIVDADLKDFFGSVDHEKLLSLVSRRVADGRVLGLLRDFLKAGSFGEGRLFPTEGGVPQGGVVSPLLSNLLLTPFDKEMRSKGYRLTRYADDWVITCTSMQEARAALAAAGKILETLGVKLHPQKTRIVHVAQGFEFLGFRIKRGRKLRLPPEKIRSGARSGEMYAYPREKSIQKFKDQIRKLTQRKMPLTTQQVIDQINPVLRGWGHHYKRAHVRRLFHQLDEWVRRRIWSHRIKHWRNCGWKTLPEAKLHGEMSLVLLIRLIPSIASQKRSL